MWGQKQRSAGTPNMKTVLVDRKSSHACALRGQKQGVPLSQLMEAIMLTREHLWEYLKHEANLDKPAEVFGELEMMELLEQFFDKALYFAAVGYEKAAHETQREPVPVG